MLGKKGYIPTCDVLSVELGCKSCFLEIVPDRSAAAFIPVFISDSWQSYNGISSIQLGIYSH
jgi:hypothetical protein